MFSSLFCRPLACLIVCSTHQLIVGSPSPLRLVAVFLPPNDVATLASSTVCCRAPLSSASLASFGTVTALSVNARAESHVFWNTDVVVVALRSLSRPLDDAVDERSRLCRASWASCNLLDDEGFCLPPHCSHALMTTNWRVMVLLTRQQQQGPVDHNSTVERETRDRRVSNGLEGCVQIETERIVDRTGRVLYLHPEYSTPYPSHIPHTLCTQYTIHDTHT